MIYQNIISTNIILNANLPSTVSTGLMIKILVGLFFCRSHLNDFYNKISADFLGVSRGSLEY